MLSVKPWKTEAILRLGLAILVCQFLGATALAVTRYGQGMVSPNVWLFWALVAGAAGFSGAALFLLRRPWDPDRFTRQFFLLLLLTYLGLTCSALVQHLAGKASVESPTLRAIFGALSFQGAALWLIWCFVRQHGVSWNEGFGFSVNLKMALAWGTVAACVFLPAAKVLQSASLQIMTRAGLKPEVQAAVQALKETSTWADQLAIGLSAIALAPLAEEMLFRGILYPAIKQAGYPRTALWGTSLLFALIHWNLPIVLPLLALSLLLTFIYERTNNLLAPIAAHSLFNAVNFAEFHLRNGTSWDWPWPP